jgi:glycosyltransferase involved in cell wall biosynthesis
MEPLISVIVPVYNVEAYLDQCIESIVAQSYRHLEILVVDDGSTDSSGEKCDQWAQRDERIQVFHQPNGGLSAARNTALDAMHGELVTMVDSDDVLRPDAIEVLYHIMGKHMASITVGGYVPFYDGDPQWPIEDQELSVRHFNQNQAIDAVFYQNGLTHSAWGRLYEASVLKGIRYPVGKNYEDLAVIYPLLLKCGRVVKIKYALYGYRQRQNSILGAFSPKRADVLDICENLEKLMERQGPDYLPAIRSRLLSAYFNILLLSNQDKDNDHNVLKARCWEGIKRLRFKCLIDPKVRQKNKIGILASYLGRGVLCDVIGRNYSPKA